ncbi:MAG: DUF192 domain-containing protein [Actinomycetota bacterium]
MAVRLVCGLRRVSVADDVRDASTPLKRARGLIRATLPRAAALRLPGAKRIHTFGMEFPIDVIFCDRGLRILQLERHLGPRRITPRVRGADVVFELHAGACDLLEVGDRLSLQCHDSAL